MERKQEENKSKSSNNYKDSTKENPNGHKNPDKSFLVDTDANHLLSGTAEQEEFAIALFEGIYNRKEEKQFQKKGKRI